MPATYVIVELIVILVTLAVLSAHGGASPTTKTNGRKERNVRRDAGTPLWNDCAIAGARAYFLETVTVGSAGGKELGENREQSARFGGVFAHGGERRTRRSMSRKQLFPVSRSHRPLNAARPIASPTDPAAPAAPRAPGRRR